MIPIHWTTSHEKPQTDQVRTFIDRKIEGALSNIYEEVSSPNPKEYKQGLEPKLDARLRAHHQFLEGAKDPFGFTEKEYDACESWNRLSVRARAAQDAFVEFVKKKNFEMTQVLKKFSTENDTLHFQLGYLLAAHKRLLDEYYYFAISALSMASFVLNKETIQRFFEYYHKVNESRTAILVELSRLDSGTLSTDIQAAIHYVNTKHDDLLEIFQDYLKSHTEVDLQKFENLLYHSTVDTNFNRKLILLLDSTSPQAEKIVSLYQDPLKFLKEFSYKFNLLERAFACVKKAEALAERIIAGGMVEDHEKLLPQDAKVLFGLMNFKYNLEEIKKAGISLPQIFFFLELIDRFEQVLKKVPSPNLSKGTLFVHDGPSFDEFCYQQQTILGSLTARLTKGPESHAGIITTKPRYPDGKDTTKDVFFSHVMGEYRFEDASEPFLPPYLIAYKVDLTNLVQEKALPLLHDLLGPDYEEKLERLWTKSKSEVAQSIELPDVENGFLHRLTSVFKSSSKLTGFDQSSIESVTSRGKTQMFCSEYARLNLIATSNVFEKKLKKLLSKKAERPGFEQQKQDLQKIPHLIYHLAHEKSRIASSTPAGLVNKYQRDSKKSPDSAKYRKAILVPLDQVDTDTWANWGKLFRLPKSSSIE